MNRIYFIISFVLTSLSFSQITAITDKGDKVTLNSDGTWHYGTVSQDTNISVNDRHYEKDLNSDFFVRSRVADVGFWIDPTKWKFSKGSSAEEIEYFFEHDADELVGFAVVEKTVIPFEMMEEVVVSNAKSGGAQNITINKREFRYVNNNKILYLEYTASIYDMPFNFHVYILSAKNTGTIQFAASTTLDLKNRYLNEIESFLNGIELY